jgi:hypothetical protein
VLGAAYQKYLWQKLLKRNGKDKDAEHLDNDVSVHRTSLHGYYTVGALVARAAPHKRSFLGSRLHEATIIY